VAKNKEITFLAGIRMVGLDDVGIIQKITNIVSGDLKINMSSMSIDTKEGLFEGSIKVFVHDREELDILCDRLSRIQDIHTVERIEQKND
jgi:GTP pyrophosphokinase